MAANRFLLVAVSAVIMFKTFVVPVLCLTAT